MYSVLITIYNLSVGYNNTQTIHATGVINFVFSSLILSTFFEILQVLIHRHRFTLLNGRPLLYVMNYCFHKRDACQINILP